MQNFNERYNDYLSKFNFELNNALNSLNTNNCDKLIESIIYSVKDGGKRIRPVLCYAIADALGLGLNLVTDYAIAIELIHSYSLVHDDLECMDNDDYRRGKLSTHKKYGEAMGVLTGDALLNLAIEVAINRCKDLNDIEVVKHIFEYSGYSGMIKGQVLDMETNKISSEDYLIDIILNKTSKLITLPLLVPSILCGKVYYSELKDLGFNLGMLFQITDDILDVESSLEEMGKTTNKDKDEDKLTYISLFSIDKAKEKAKEHYINAKNILKNIPNNEFLNDLTDFLYARKK